MRHSVLALALAVGLMAWVAAQPVAEPALKAAFLYNFAKFTEWPAESLPPRGPLVICTNASGVARALADMTKGRLVAGHRLDVQEIALDSPTLRACHVLYAADLNVARAERVLNGLKGAAVLTVGDLEEFVPLGGVAQFFVEDDRVRFRIGVDSAARARLRFSSQLLSLAKIA